MLVGTVETHQEYHGKRCLVARPQGSVGSLERPVPVYYWSLDGQVFGARFGLEKMMDLSLPRLTQAAPPDASVSGSGLMTSQKPDY